MKYEMRVSIRIDVFLESMQMQDCGVPQPHGLGTNGFTCHSEQCGSIEDERYEGLILVI